jgi:hypothetical protein
MKLPILFASAFIVVGAFTAGSASAAPLSSSLSLGNVNADQVETVRYRHHYYRYSHRGYRSFAFAPRFRSNRNFGAVRSCNTIRPWKDEAFNSAYPSRRCQ